MVPSLFHPPQWGIWGGISLGGPFSSSHCPEPFTTPQAPQHHKCPHHHIRSPKFGDKQPANPYPSATRELEAPPDVPSPPGDLRQPPPPGGDTPGCRWQQGAGTRRARPRGCGRRQQRCHFTFLGRAGSGADGGTATQPPGTPPCHRQLPAPQKPPPRGHQGPWGKPSPPGFGEQPPGPSPGHQPCQRSPFPRWAPLLVQAARPETCPKKPFWGHFGAVPAPFGIPTRDGSTPGTLRPNTRRSLHGQPVATPAVPSPSHLGAWP